MRPAVSVGGMKLRGCLTIATVGAMLAVGDVIQRVVIKTLLKMFPARREAVLSWWQRRLAIVLIGSVRMVGGGRFRSLPTIPSCPGVLILMNHQSLLDIPLANLLLEDGYPRIVTRKRYSRGIPLISHMIRLYEYPVVDSNTSVKGHFETLRKVALSSEAPVLIYPEGTRSLDGQLLPFRKGALNVLLRNRTWMVYLAVADGVLPCGQLSTILKGVHEVNCRVRVLGPFDSPADSENILDWLNEMEGRMRNELHLLRTAPQQ